MQSRQRYRLLDHGALAGLLGAPDAAEMSAQKRAWVEEALGQEAPGRDPSWSESLAVGHEEFVQGVKKALGLKVRKREVIKGDRACVLREPEAGYGISALKIPL